MPLRDHFHPPLSHQTSWDSFYGGWPMVIVQRLNPILPARYVAGPHVHLGTQIEVDVAGLENEEPHFAGINPHGTNYQPTSPTVAVEKDLLATDEYEVRVFDTERNRRVVAVVEIVSPSNKDRPESRRVFAANKCEAMLQSGVSVVIVDIVTSRHFNLYTDLLELIDETDSSMGEQPSAIYAAACRWVQRGKKYVFETWSHVLAIGETLPTLPLWLNADLAMPLELGESYEDTCRALKID